MIGSFFDWLLGSQARVIILSIGAVGTFVGAVVALLQYRRWKALDDDVLRLRTKLQEKEIELADKTKLLSERDNVVTEREARLAALREAVRCSEAELWLIHAAKPFPGYYHLIGQRRPLVLTVANLKGGVGKTTLAANLAADFDLSAGKRVLVIDLDYQGSLSSMMLLAEGIVDIPSRVNSILDGTAEPSKYSELGYRLKNTLPNTWVIPAYYELAPLENRLMVNWLMQDGDEDVQYRLAKYVFSDEIKSNFDIVIVDCPPRLMTGTINALCAATHLLVPTIFDKMSSEAVGTFLNAMRGIRMRLNPGLELLGIVGTITQQQNRLHPKEQEAWDTIERQARRIWFSSPHIFERFIPRRIAFSKAAGQSVAYFDNEGDVRELVGTLGIEVRRRIGL